jgi:hypothetical protein
MSPSPSAPPHATGGWESSPLASGRYYDAVRSTRVDIWPTWRSLRLDAASLDAHVRCQEPAETAEALLRPLTWPIPWCLLVCQGEQRSRVVADEAIAVPAEQADEPIEETFRWWTGVKEETDAISEAAAQTQVASASVHAGDEGSAHVPPPPPPHGSHNTHFRWWTGVRPDASELKTDAAEAVRDTTGDVATGVCSV